MGRTYNPTELIEMLTDRVVYLEDNLDKRVAYLERRLDRLEKEFFIVPLKEKKS